jgi:hypothetical protein
MTPCQGNGNSTKQNGTPNDYSGHVHGNSVKYFPHFRPSVSLHYKVLREKNSKITYCCFYEHLSSVLNFPEFDHAGLRIIYLHLPFTSTD